MSEKKTYDSFKPSKEVGAELAKLKGSTLKNSEACLKEAMEKVKNAKHNGNNAEG